MTHGALEIRIYIVLYNKVNSFCSFTVLVDLALKSNAVWGEY